MEFIKPGTDNKSAGTYKEVGPRGEKVEDARTVEIQYGDRLPPNTKRRERVGDDKVIEYNALKRRPRLGLLFVDIIGT